MERGTIFQLFYRRFFIKDDGCHDKRLLKKCPPDAGADLAELKSAVPTRERGKNGQKGALPMRERTSRS